MTIRPPLPVRLMTAFLVVAALLPAACSDDSDPAPGTVALGLTFEVGGLPLAYNSILYTNAAGDQYSVETLHFYLSQVVLKRTWGSDHAPSVVHYCDANDLGTRTLELRDVPPGEYDGIQFVFGLTDADNVADGLPATPENINMAWPETMGGGYHYMKLEGKFVRAGETQERTYRTHTGRVMSASHFIPMDFTFNRPITVDGDAWEIYLTMDVNEWFQNPHEYAFPDDPMIMGNLELQGRLRDNGADVFTFDSVQLKP